MCVLEYYFDLFVCTMHLHWSINRKTKRQYIFYTSTKKNPNKNAQGFFLCNKFIRLQSHKLSAHIPSSRDQNSEPEWKRKVFANWFYLFRYSKKYFSSLNQTFHALAFVNSKQEEKSIHVNNAVHSYIHELIYMNIEFRVQFHTLILYYTIA